jgi:hypothetical protein
MALTALEALQAIQRELHHRTSDEVPDGWITVEAWAKQARKSEYRCRQLLDAGVEMGRIEVREFRLPIGNHVRPVRHYRQVTEQKKGK